MPSTNPYLRLRDGDIISIRQRTDVHTPLSLHVTLTEIVIHDAVHPLIVYIQRFDGIAKIRAMQQIGEHLKGTTHIHTTTGGLQNHKGVNQQHQTVPVISPRSSTRSVDPPSG